MRRYALTALAIGGIVSLFVLVLYFVGAFDGLALWLEETYRTRGLFSGEDVVRLKWLEITLIVLASIAVSWCVVDVSQMGQKVLVAGSGLLLMGAVSPALALHDWYFEPFSVSCSVLLSSALAFVFAGTERGMRKRILEEVIGVRVSRRTFDELLESEQPPDFSGAKREVTVLTCRLLDHEGSQERLEAAELVKLGNLFHRTVSNFLVARGAYLDESGPELVRAYFGVLQPDPDHAAAACAAALELTNRMRNLSQECESRWFQPLAWGVGISSGEMTVGVYGTPEHSCYSAVGGETEYARRLACANRRYGSRILIGPDTYQLVSSDFVVRPMEMFYDPESGVMTEIYEVLARTEDSGEKENERRDLFWKGVIFLREERYEEALDHLSRSRQPGVEDSVLEFFLQQAQEGIADAEGDEGGGTGLQSPDEGHARLINLM